MFKMKLTLIVAISDNNVIGANGKVPWHIPEDLKRFKELTIGHPVIMGRKTYDSLPDKFRPLPDRENIVLSSSLESQEKVYHFFLPIINKLEITRVHRTFEGDSFFPEINLDEWKISRREKWNPSMREEKVGEHDIPYSFLTYLRK